MQYTVELEMNAPREKVAELFSDPDSIAKWQPGFVSMEHLSGEKGKSGAQYRLLYKHGKREVEMIETVTTDNLPERFVATYEAPGMSIEVNNRFEEAGPDKTKWISENNGTTSGFLMKLMTLIMPGCFKKQSQKWMEHFKALAEDGTDVRDAGAKAC